MYRRTVGGETVRPSFRRSSAAMRSSPQVRLARAMSAIRRWSVGESAADRGNVTSRARTDEEVSVPAHERVRTYDRQHVPPGDQPGEQHEGDRGWGYPRASAGRSA